MDTEHVGLQPWQVFTAMFVVFWATSAYFDHFLMTGVFCIAFGVLGEISTKFMYGEKISFNLEKQKEELKVLLELAKQEEIEEEPEKELKNIEEQESQSEYLLRETMSVEPEEFLEDDEDVPPPLPAKDYNTEVNDIIELKANETIDPINNSNITEEVFISEDQQLTGPDKNIKIEVIEQIDINTDMNTNSTLEIPISSSHTTEIVMSDSEADKDKTEIDCEESEVNQSADVIQDLQINPIETVEVIKIQQDSQENKIIKEGMDEVEINLSDICPPEIDIEQTYVCNDANNMTALAESAVNNNLSFKECDDFDQIKESEENPKADDHNKNVEHDLTEEVIVQSKVDTENNISEEDCKNTDIFNTVMEAATATSGNPEIDIDLTDPAVEAAATKIQSAFKGFKIRKNQSNKQ